jgi:hypothetical protein
MPTRKLPDSLSDRGQDNWRPLIAIADAIGHGWGERARQAAVALDGDGTGEEPTAGAMLLSDVMSIFEDRHEDRLSSAAIVECLNEMEDRPWPEWRRGKPLTQNSLARLLKPFGVLPRNFRMSAGIVKGYERGPIEDAHKRYGVTVAHASPDSPFQSATPLQDNKNNGLGENQTATSKRACSGLEYDKSLKSNDCSGVAVENSTDGTEWVDL